MRTPQTLNIAVPRLDKFAYVGVFSAGILGGPPGSPSALEAFETRNLASLDGPAGKRALRLLWFGPAIQ